MLKPLELKIEVNDTQADKDVDEFARDTGKKLDKLRLIELRANTDNLDLKLFKLREELKRIKADWRDGILDEKAFKRVSSEIRKTSSELTEAKRRVQNLKNTWDESLSRLQAKFDGIWNTIRRSLLSSIAKIWVSIWALVSSRQIWRLSESFTGLTNRLKQVSEWEGLDELRRKIFRAANDSRTSVEAYAQSFVRFDLVNRQLWGTQDETLKILDSLSKGLSATGAQATEVSSVMLQLAQAFGSGRLAGDEFRSVSENMPILLDILAKRLWVARWELKEMAADGLITSQVLKWALLDANEQLNESFNKTSITISQAFTIATNNLIAKFWELDQQYSITERIVQGIQFLWKAAVIAFDLIAKLFVWISSAIWLLKDGFDIATDAIKSFTDFVIKNAKVITSVLVAAFVTIRRESLKNLIVGTFWAIQKSILFLLKDLPKLTAQIVLQSKAIAINTVVKIKNAAASITLSKALNILSLSFLRTRWASIAMLKSIVTIGKRIFIVAGIFTTVAVTIFKNWDNLRKKFTGIFEIIAKAWDAGANIVAWAWNGAVSIVSGAARLVLSSAEKVVSALNKIPWVDIDTSWLNAAVWSIDDFADWLKITGQDVKWTFAAIWSSAKWLIDDFTWIWGWAGDLWWDISDLWWIIWDLWDESEEAWNKWAAAAKKQEDALENFKDTAKETYNSIQDAREDNNNQIEEEQEKINDLKQEYDELKNDAVESIRGIKNELKTLNEDEDNELAERRLEILEEQKEAQKEIAELWNQTTEDLEKRRELEQELVGLENELALINENVTADVLQQVEAYDKLNETQKILADNAEKRKQIEEELLLQQAIAEGRQFDITTSLDDEGNLKAFVKDSQGAITEITDFENIERANKLLKEAEARKQEVLLLQDSIQQKQNLELELVNQLRFIESNYTSFITSEWKQREQAVKDYSKTAIAEIARLKAAADAANISIPSFSSSSTWTSWATTNNITNNIEVNNATAGAAVASTDTLINNITSI